MKILVTGHRGYLGSGFVDRYLKAYEIEGYDLLDGDNLLDFNRLKSKMKGNEMVVHLAAIPGPAPGKSFEDYFRNNVEATFNVAKAAVDTGIKRIIYASSTTVYGIEKGIPFKSPVTEELPFVSQYLAVADLSCREVDLSYHMSKVMAEQIMAWHGLNKKVQTVVLRFGPVDKVFLGTSVSMNNACQAIDLAIKSSKEFWYEPFSIVDVIGHINISKARTVLGYAPERPRYTADQIHSTFEDRTKK